MWEEGEASLERSPYHDDASDAKTGRSGVLVGPFFLSPSPPLIWDTPGCLMLKSAKDKPLSWMYIWDYVMKGLCNGCQPQKESTGGWACVFLWGLDIFPPCFQSFSSYIHVYFYPFTPISSISHSLRSTLYTQSHLFKHHMTPIVNIPRHPTLTL